ncbi:MULTISPECIES: hypothetical protein [unclassified Brevundimonas]|uniref:hypothetical protein n=1 Tax=unclassified Brevundimonas TaxID=2622653 RepID=UPI0025C42C3E|nr:MULTISPECIES: hypothetical protein [unclassified Brevundimonas]
MARRRKTAEDIQAETLVVPGAADDMLKSGVNQFSAASWMFQMFAQKVPQRTSMRQIYAFTLVLEALSNGREIIVSDLKELAGDDEKGEPIFGQSIGRSYQLLMEPTKRDPDGLGWIRLETDENDQRRKLVRLTEEGVKIARIIKGYMSGAKPNE